MQKLHTKTILTLSAIAVATVLLLIFTLRFMSTLTHWPDGKHINNTNSGGLATIGTWQPRSIISVDFDDAVADLKDADPFLRYQIRLIHILGSSSSNERPIEPVSIAQYDVLLFHLDGHIIAMQVVGDISPNIFSSWADFRSYINTRHNSLFDTNQNFSSLNRYTRSHAAIFYNGYRWFARHDSVTSVPHISDDWFRKSERWVAQNYPVGAFVSYNNRQWRKVSAQNSMPNIAPSASNASWQEVPFVDRETFDVELWSSGNSYSRLDVVKYYNGLFYVSLADNNSATPSQSSLWQEFVQFDPNNLVPRFDEYRATAYPIGSLVYRIVDGEVRYFVQTQSWQSVPGVGGSWQRVYDFLDRTSVVQWSPTAQYGPSMVGTLVEHNGLVFQRMDGHGGNLVGIEPLDLPSFWRRILTYEETQNPIEFTPDYWLGNRIFQSTATNGNVSFYALLPNNQTNPHHPTSTSHAFFRPVRAWSPTFNYSVVGSISVWGGASQMSHAYTIDAYSGQRIFWEVYNSPTGANGTVLGVAPSDYLADGITPNPFWRRHNFRIEEDILVTRVQGRPVVWDRVPNVDNPRRPSVTNSDWVRRAFPINDQYVKTIFDGEITLWRNIIGENNSYEAGNPLGWQRAIFASNNNFVYTVNSVGVYSFWFSPSYSSVFPAVGSDDWQRLDYGVILTLPEFFYMLDDVGTIQYFTLTSGGAFKHLSNVWTGHGIFMRNEWNRHSVFEIGDVVAYGITLTHTVRYFVMRENINPMQASGVPPLSPLGGLFWQPIR